MSTIFYWIQDLFVNFIFKYTMDPFRSMHSWWGANSINWVFMIIGFIAMVYWMRQLKIFNDNGEEDKSSTSHSYL